MVRDKPERTQATLKELADMAAAGSVPAIAGSLRGKLQFAKGQAFGGSGAFGLHGLGALERGPPRPPGPFLDGLLEFWVGYFRDLVPRTVLLRDLRPPVVVAVDGAVEGDGVGLATFGAVLFDPAAGGPAQVIAEEVAEAPAAEWRAEGSKNVIMQAELLPAAVAACTWRESVRGRMVFLLVDNESARFALIKGYSAAQHSARLVGEFWKAAGAAECPTWVLRVPSSSNPADGPSRGRWPWVGGRWARCDAVPPADLRARWGEVSRPLPIF